MSENCSKLHYHKRREQDFSVTVRPQFLHVFYFVSIFLLLKRFLLISLSCFVLLPSTLSQTLCASLDRNCNGSCRHRHSKHRTAVGSVRMFVLDFRSGNTNPLQAACHVPHAYLSASVYFLVQGTNLSLGI